MPADFEKQSYWRERFATETQFEWLSSSATFMALIEPQLSRLDKTARIMQLGFGTSDLQNHLRQRGFLDVTNVDFEPLAVERGQQLEREAFGDVRMRYAVGDATQLERPQAEYDLVIDKSTVDAVSCGGENMVLRMAAGVKQSLTDHGTWVSLSYSASRFANGEIPFEVEVLDKVLTPKLQPNEPDVYHWCYLLRPRE